MKNKLMRAAVLYEVNKPLVVEDIAVPDLKEGQVLVKMKASGVCHKQLEDVSGKHGEDKWLPHLLGHEGSGVVESVGKGVTKVIPNNHVILSWITGSGRNAETPIYKIGDKRINAGTVTTFNNYAIVAENKITPIKNSVPFKEACLIGCAVPTGVGAVINESKVEEDKIVVVYGIGGVGLNIIQGAKLSNSKKIIAIDINEKKLNRSKEFGATDVVNATNLDPVDEIKNLTDGKGADYVFESVGLKLTMEQAYNSASNSGLVNLVGNPAYNEKIEIDALKLHYGRKLIGGHGGNSVPERDFYYYIDLYLNKKLDLTAFVDNVYSIENINQALLDLSQGRVLRPIIEFN